jgi:DUF4097 and DUF4098 domain-containing protein YvlB
LQFVVIDAIILVSGLYVSDRVGADPFDPYEAIESIAGPQARVPMAEPEPRKERNVEERQNEATGPEAPPQTGRNRNLWIVAAIIIVVACACGLGAAALVTGSLLVSDREAGVPALPDFRSEQMEEYVVDVRPGTRLQVDNFAGVVKAEAGPDGQIEIVAIKSGPSGADLTRIQVEVEERGDVVVVRTSRPAGRSNLNVRLELRAPADTGLDLQTGAGDVEVQGFVAGVAVETGSGSIIARGLVGNVGLRSGSGSVDAQDVEGQLSIDSGSGSLTVQGVNGDLEAHTGSGGIEVIGANGNARLDTGSGTVEYQGAPRGECRFETGTGSVVLRLPAELDFRIQADTGSGSIDVQFEVEGRVSRRHVEGVVGTGQEATIIASTGSGGVDVFPY